MAESTTVKNAKDGTLAVINGTRTYTVALEQGNFSATGQNEGNYDTTNVQDRGVSSHRRKTNQRPVPFTFTAWLRDLTDATDVTLVGMLLRKGASVADLPISGLSTTEVYEVDIRWTIDGTTHGDAANHVMLLEDCRIDSVDFSEAEDKNVVSISGICYGAVTLS
jgi:hypothetical protein